MSSETEVLRKYLRKPCTPRSHSPLPVSQNSVHRLYHYRQVSAQKAQYQNLVENLGVGVFQATVTGKYLMVNPMLAEILGYDSCPQLCKNLKHIPQQLYVSPTRHTELLQQLQTQPRVQGFESQVYRRDGQIIWISENLRPIYHAQGQLIGYEGTVEDITDRKQQMAELESALTYERERQRLQAHFISMVSHEFRSFLTLILVTTDLLRLHGQKMNHPEKLQYLDKIRSTVKDMNELLEGVLTIDQAESKSHPFEIESVELDTVCQDVWQDIQASAQTTHQFVYSVAGDRLIFTTHLPLLRLVLRNLLSNAVKYSESGTVIRCSLDSQNRQVTFKVQDQGIGIPLEEQSKLFEVFYRAKNARKYSGSGLGLAIVKRAVTLQGGTIAVESQVGEGTTFTVILPALCTSVRMSEHEAVTVCVWDNSSEAEA